MANISKLLYARGEATSFLDNLQLTANDCQSAFKFDPVSASNFDPL